jgi:hypothetical protein
MNPGEIHLIQFDPSIGFEIQKSRPGLVIQSSFSIKSNRSTSADLWEKSEKFSLSNSPILL